MIAFGAGLPRGNPLNLTWNRLGIVRNYHKPWREGSVLEPDDITVEGEGGEEQFEDETRLDNEALYARETKADGK